jgi:NAD(P)-dependent dehydrogenase (short-subunit alcohol dehydrogenase family)
MYIHPKQAPTGPTPSVFQQLKYRNSEWPTGPDPQSVQKLDNSKPSGNDAPMPSLPLEGQNALVTGAARRIGRAIALGLARAGASVAVHYNASKAEAESAVEEIQGMGRQSFTLRADISSSRQVARMFQTLQKRWQRLDLLVNNAAIFFQVPWNQLTEEDWNKILGTNLKGTFFCAQQAARMMMERKCGRIINISSLGGLQAWPGYMHYCASKAGVIMLTRCLAKALAPHVLVNTIAPGTILLPDEKASEGQKVSIHSAPLGRAGEAEDIAEMVLFLATGARYITGQVFPVDGGKSIP